MNRSIEKIELLGEEYQFGIHEYLYSLFVRFTLFHLEEIEWRGKTMVVSDRGLVIELRDLLSTELEDLLYHFYQEPNHKRRSKFPGRYRKFELNERKYTVDYTTNFFGSMVYSIFNLIQWINSKVISDESL